MVTSNAVLGAVLDVMDRPWCWGAADCCTAACDVFERLHGIDPMRSLRGLYVTRTGAARIIAQRGGFVAMAEGLAVGLHASIGKPGDIGVIEMDNGPALAICIARRQWAGKTETGFTTVPDFLRCWGA